MKLFIAFLNLVTLFPHGISSTPLLHGQSLPWYHRTIIYQIYVRSFFDSDGDGIGDLRGIIRQLDYLQALGVETLWLSPFFASPQKDFGYDVTDYRSVAPEYGTMQDAERLIEEVHRRRMKIILDLVLNHTSEEHRWFQQDLERPPGERGSDKDYYVWSDRPNNWRSAVKGSAWHYHPRRGQYYYAAFLPFQPDLNYRNPAVKDSMLAVARYWLEKGVDGFRLDLFNYLYEDSLKRNNPLSLNPITGFRKPSRTQNQPETLQFAKELRALCNSYGDKMLLGEVIGTPATVRSFLGDSVNDRLTLAFCFDMLRFHFSARYFERLIKTMETLFPPPFAPVYVFSNHDRQRAASRLHGDLDRLRIVHAVQFLARGVPCIYYGEEIGMTSGRIPYKNALDPIPHIVKIPHGLVRLTGETLNRDEVRTPMLWNAGTNAGFSTASQTWLPVNPNFKERNVEKGMRDSASFYAFFQMLIRLPRPEHPTSVQRHGPVLRIGDAWLNFSRRRNLRLKDKTTGETVFLPPLSITLNGRRLTPPNPVH